MESPESYYENMSREQLLNHCLAYQDAMHQLVNRLQAVHLREYVGKEFTIDHE